MSGTGGIGEMGVFDFVMFWGTIFMVVLEIMIVLLLVYDVGLHTVWTAYYRKKTRMFVRKLKSSTANFGEWNNRMTKKLAKRVGKKRCRGRRKR